VEPGVRDPNILRRTDVNGIKMALAGLFTLVMVGMLLLSNGAAQARSVAGNVTSANPAQVATATPEAGMMVHATTTPDAGMMMSTTATPGAGMMEQQPGSTMMNSNLPTTGGSDNSDLLLLLAASLVLLLSGVGLRRILAPRK
jgi:LPXTG-motif cell wall-anchored protein